MSRFPWSPHGIDTGKLRVGVDGRFLQDKFDGVGRYLFGLLEGLLSLDGDLELHLFVDPSLPNTRFDVERLAGDPRLVLEEIGTRLYRPGELWSWPLKARHARLNVFHSPYFWSPLTLPCPLVATVHDMIFDRHPEYLPGLRLRLPYRVSSQAALRRSRRIIAVSEATAADIVRFGPSGVGRRVRTIPNGVDERFRRVLDPRVLAGIQERYRLPDHFVLALGARRPHKNIERLVSAFDRVADHVPHTLILAGSVDRRFDDRTEEQGRRLVLSGRLRSIGRVEESDLPGLLTLADLFVQPSVIEGFGLPALEAMSCGCAVALSDTSSLPEVGGDAAARFDPWSEESMAAVLERCLRSAGLREDMARRGLQQAARFTWQRTAGATLDTYLEAASRRTVPSRSAVGAERVR